MSGESVQGDGANLDQSGAVNDTQVLNRRQWLELFFDLVVVAAIAVISHGLAQHEDLAGFGLFVVLFATVWFAWVTVVMYADVAGGDTRVRTIALAMFGVAVMAASNPMHFPERANAFAIAFVFIRLLAGRGSLATGRLLRSWSGLQSSGAILVWLGSVFVPIPAKVLGVGRGDGSGPGPQLLPNRLRRGRPRGVADPTRTAGAPTQRASSGQAPA